MSDDTIAHSASAESHRIAFEMGDLDLDAVFDVLSHPHRRIALSYLLYEESVPIGDLNDHVAEQTGASADRSDVRDRIAVDFHHCHRPKMEAAGLIVSDEEAHVIAATEAAADLEPHLDRAGRAASRGR
jgi:DNA-binding transcriptional ArsR family regulator